MTDLFSEEQIKALEAEFENWQEFLNFVLGVFCFNSALACLGLKSPRIYACLALIFFVVALVIGLSRFPPSYKHLRDKSPRTKQEDIWFRGVRNKFLGFPAIFKNFPLYWLGVLTLMGVAIDILKNV